MRIQLRRTATFTTPSLLALLALAGCSSPTTTTSGEQAASESAESDGRAQAQRDLILGEGAGLEYGTLGREGFEALRHPSEAVHPDVGTTWSELTALPSVSTAYSFALAVSDADGSAHLGFMFTDATYEATLASEGVLWAGEGAYYGSNAVEIYALTGSGAASTWTPYQGRYTPQTYSFSELRFDSGDSYYTTNYPSYGGLISVIKDGGKGVYALTPATTTARAHSVAFESHVLYALAAQASVGLTLSTTPASSFGNLNDLWVNEATIETAAAAATLPELIDAGGTLVGAYIVGGNAQVRATTTPATVTSAAGFPSIGTCTGATKVAVAYAGSYLYKACVSSAGILTVQKASIASLASVTWTTVTTGVSGAVTDLDISGLGTTLSLAVRQSTSVKVFSSITDTTPSFNMVIPGTFDLQAASEGLVLSVSNLTSTANQVRTFLK